MSFINTTPANSIYPALPTGQTVSTAVLQSQLTSELEQQYMYAYVSSVAAVNGPVQFTSYADYINYKRATFANRSDPNRTQ